jgi:hypothetical protein
MKKLLIAVVAVTSINAHARDEAYCSLAPVVTTYAYNAAVAKQQGLKEGDAFQQLLQNSLSESQTSAKAAHLMNDLAPVQGNALALLYEDHDYSQMTPHDFRMIIDVIVTRNMCK